MSAAPTGRAALAEALAAWAVVTVGAVALVWFLPPALGDWSSLAVGALFLVAAIQLASRDDAGLAGHGIDLAGVLEEPEPDGPGDGRRLGIVSAIWRAVPAGLREAAIALLVAAIVFPPYGWLYGAVNAPGADFSFRWPPRWPDLVLGQLLVVALPEEAFFRGYLQTRFAQAFPARWRVFGVELAPAAIALQAVAFGLVHAIVDANPARMATAVPGLLFGVLRDWRGGIGAAIVLHAASNLCAEVLARSFIP